MEIDRHRYRKVRWFFIKALFKIAFWDLFLNRPWLRFFRRTPLPRWCALASNFRLLAVEMGGVLIKLGQFLSIRLDILPQEVINELTGLQDEVPEEDSDAIMEQLAVDFEQPVDQVFPYFEAEPLGSASLAQAHRARIPGGQDVVVKVLRPGIQKIVETDLAAISLALRGLKLFSFIRRRVNLDALMDEFTTVTRKELDFKTEGHSMEQFARDFSDDTQVYVPKIYWEYSSKHTLTLENVFYFKINAFEAMQSAGINCSQVADALHRIYMAQIFDTHFVHVDPHPGNLFVRPLPHADEEGLSFQPGQSVPFKSQRPFQIVFIDFGMMAGIPDRMHTAIREYIIGIGTQDAYRVVQSYVHSGFLLPGADLKRLELGTAEIFKRFWGISMGQLKDTVLDQADYFLSEYRDLFKSAPFQFQTDMVFIFRAIEILSGLTTSLDPEFNIWQKTVPFAEKFIKEELKHDWEGPAREIFKLGQLTYKLPGQFDRILTETLRGNLELRMSLTPDAHKTFSAITKAINRLGLMLFTTGLLMGGINLYLAGEEGLGAMLLGLSLLILIRNIKI